MLMIPILGLSCLPKLWENRFDTEKFIKDNLSNRQKKNNFSMINKWKIKEIKSVGARSQVLLNAIIYSYLFITELHSNSWCIIGTVKNTLELPSAIVL